MKKIYKGILQITIIPEDEIILTSGDTLEFKINIPSDQITSSKKPITLTTKISIQNKKLKSDRKMLGVCN